MKRILVGKYYNDIALFERLLAVLFIGFFCIVWRLIQIEFTTMVE